MTMLSRIAGLIRDVVFARMLGASDNADAFFIAFKIPQFLRRLFAEGAFAQAFVPVLAEYKRSKNEENNLEAVRGLINAVCGALSGTLLLLTSFIILAAPLVTFVFAPGFADQPDKFDITASMLRITFPYLFLISLTGFAGGILNSYGRFAVPAFTPVLLNFTLIAFALWVSPYLDEPVFALAWGVLFAGFIQLFFQIPFLANLSLLPKPVLDFGHPGVKKIIKLMLPAIFAVSVSQINLLLDTVLASFLPGGSVSWLYYSDRLVELPLGVFGIAIATVILPALSMIDLKNKNEQTAEQFRQTLLWALRCILFIALPATVALIILAEPILFVLFQYDAMTPNDVNMSAFSLQAYALGLSAFMLIKVLASTYFSQQDTRTPVKIGVIAMVANMLLNLLLVALMHFKFGIGHTGLALATSLSAMLNAYLLYRGLVRKKQFFAEKPLLNTHFLYFTIKILVAAIFMGGALLVMMPEGQFWVEANFLNRVLFLAQLCGSGLLAFIMVALVLGLRPRDFRAANSQSELTRQ